MAEYRVKRPIVRAPVHPGELLKTDVLPVLELSVSEISKTLHISRQHLHRILAGSQPMSVSIALKISRLTGVSAKLLMSMQQNFDLWHAQNELKHALDQIELVQAKEPLVKYLSKKESKKAQSSSVKKKTGPQSKKSNPTNQR